MKIFIALLLTAIIYVSDVSADAEELKTALLVDVTKLIAEAERLQATLKDKGLLAEAIAIDAAVIAVKEVETQLLNLHPEDAIGQILLVAAEATLNQVEKMLAAQLKKLEAAAGAGSRKKRDLQTDLLLDVTRLIADAERLQATLKDKGQLAEAIALDASIMAIKEVETQLMTLHPEDTIGQILLVAAEATLQAIEKKIAAELKRLEDSAAAAGTTRRKRDLQTDLLLDVTRLIADAERLQATLKDKGQLAEAIALDASIMAIKEVETQLMTLHPEDTIGQILLVAAEATLQAIEKKIAAELKRLEDSAAAAGTTRRKRDLQTDLLLDVTRLIADAERLQATLKDKGQLAEAIALDASIMAIKEVETQLMTLHPSDTMGQILLVAAEATLNAIEKKIAAELKRLEDSAAATGTTRRKRDAVEDVKEHLVTDISALIARGLELQQKMHDKGLLAEAIAIEATIIAVKDIEQSLLNLHPSDPVGQVLLVAAEATLQMVEKKLAEEEAKLIAKDAAASS